MVCIGTALYIIPTYIIILFRTLAALAIKAIHSIIVYNTDLVHERFKDDIKRIRIQVYRGN